ncbi:MAG: hypothetical protein CMJ81_04180 [Planctomycetaceae bacterium]|jgi:hypothetical protein|nr:hypothetical protein [Planctomycetaceae bacterium]MBP60690.1 hypothetical protein [Planctomycetaceae bacterium]
MPERVYKQFGAGEVVGGVEFATRVAGSCPHSDVLLVLAGDEKSPEVFSIPGASVPTGPATLLPLSEKS